MSHTPEHKILGRALRVFKHPGGFISGPVARRFEQRYEGKYRFARSLFAVDLILAGFIIALIAFIGSLWLGQPLPPQRIKMTLAVEPADVRSGDRATLRYTYENDFKKTWSDVSLAFRLPRGFEVTNVEPALYDRTNNQIDLGTLRPGVRGEVTLTGTLVVEPGKEEETTVTVSTSGDAAVRDIRPVRLPFTIRGTVLDVHAKFPEAVEAGTAISVPVQYENSGTAALLGAVIAVGDERIRTGPLEPGQKGSGSVTLVAAQPGALPVKQITAIETPHGLVTQEVVEQTVNVIPSFLDISSSFPDPGDFPVTSGSEMETIIMVSNNGSETLTDPQISVRLMPGTAELVKTDPDPLPARLAPGERATVTWRMKVPSTFSAVASGEAPSVAYSIEVAGRLEKSGSIVVRREWTGMIKSDLVLKASARYYSPEGEQLGRGPLPPRVGSATTYWLSVSLTPTPNPVRGVAIEAQLAPNVRWNGKGSFPSRPLYNAASRVLRWNLGDRVPGDAVSLSFSGELTPITEQIGKPAPLVVRVTASGEDAALNTLISSEVRDITTDLVADPRAAGKGSVIK